MIKLYKKYIRHKMFNKMLLIYSTITIISIFLLANIFVNYYIDSKIQNELKIHSEVVFNIEKRFEEQNNISNSIANGINTQQSITNEISILTTATYEEYLSYKLDNFTLSNIKQVDLKYVIDTMLSNRKDALAVVINDKDKVYKNEIVLNHDEWYEMKNDKKDNLDCRKITKAIKNIDNMYTIGYIDVYFNLNNLNKIVDNSNLKGDLIIFDKEDNIIFDSNKISNENYIKKIKSKQIYDLNESKSIIGNLKKEYPIISIQEDAQNGLKYASIIEKNDLNSKYITLQIGSISTICILIILFITYIAINNYSAKLKRMMKKINEIKDGNLDIRFKIENEDDELDMIAMRIDDMSESLQYNINKNYIAEVKQKEAEINALQAQIKPHFLYNTLEVIRMSALASKNTEVAQMIYNLASMFRYSTYDNGSMVTLNEEIKHSKMYLNLCSTRYKNMMSYSINIEDEYLNYLLPKFSIQPILENSINHGLRKEDNDNLVSISLVKVKEGIELIIKDNGHGINEEKLNKIELDLKKNLQKNSSIGLMNINNRLKLKFGDCYGLSINSKENEGTTVKVKLPIIRGEIGNV